MNSKRLSELANSTLHVIHFPFYPHGIVVQSNGSLFLRIGDHHANSLFNEASNSDVY